MLSGFYILSLIYMLTKNESNKLSYFGSPSIISDFDMTLEFEELEAIPT